MARTILFYFLLQFIRALRASCRYQIHGEDTLPPRDDDLKGGFVMAFWHQNLVAAIMAETGRRSFTTMVSRSRDGDAIAHVVRSFGHHPARGSSRRDARDKGGKQARDELVDMLKQGYPGAVTVDGPVGPLYEVKFGVIDMAIKSTVPIVPYLVVADRYWSLPSWDKIRVPKPFSTVHVYYGKPIAVAVDTNKKDYPALQQQIKQELDRMEQQYNPPGRLPSP